MHVQDYINLHNLRMSAGTFSLDAAHMMYVISIQMYIKVSQRTCTSTCMSRIMLYFHISEFRSEFFLSGLYVLVIIYVVNSWSCNLSINLTHLTTIKN